MTRARNPSSVGARVRSALFAPVVLSLGTVPGCERPTTHELRIVEGGTITRFPIQSAHAEYVELEGQRNELRLTLAGYATTCDVWVPPRDGEAAVTVVITLPQETRPTRASYPWAGLPATDEPIREAYALPKAHIGRRSRLFEPGGAVRLSDVPLDPHGTVTGTLAFEFPGDGERPATRVEGGFRAKICRLALTTR